MLPPGGLARLSAVSFVRHTIAEPKAAWRPREGQVLVITRITPRAKRDVRDRRQGACAHAAPRRQRGQRLRRRPSGDRFRSSGHAIRQGVQDLWVNTAPHKALGSRQAGELDWPSTPPPHQPSCTRHSPPLPSESLCEQYVGIFAESYQTPNIASRRKLVRFIFEEMKGELLLCDEAWELENEPGTNLGITCCSSTDASRTKSASATRKSRRRATGSSVTDDRLRIRRRHCVRNVLVPVCVVRGTGNIVSRSCASRAARGR